ncbi:hypothetical protein CupriaWKF_33185 [Cupriavidus sp. WKF15]|uniref:hypothetical protein n=1 Tax=Cupriavidus sp. WKF15 TaxID=3032282 RepID=UPI0023E28889|nr:hypothetical protein [Cupriavidus sp. WKF15]WER50422.1 hypothetical protein CupriaWKF_33185 [Cupriavidus sp. WKF15]
MPTYEEGRLAAIAVRLALSSGLPPANAKAALELASTMIGNQLAGAPAQNKEPCVSTVARGHRGGVRNCDVSSSERL